ncbi:hypothetical protein [Paenibacillus tarimensis]|nr:hypothetical protein [Paenibacillus tarimensis]MCF2942712.1 hypothetical protein [Paenibacillus tarimensis]
MPYNRSEETEHQQNMKSNKEEAITQKPKKAADRPPNMNNIEKELP